MSKKAGVFHNMFFLEISKQIDITRDGTPGGNNNSQEKEKKLERYRLILKSLQCKCKVFTVEL